MSELRSGQEGVILASVPKLIADLSSETESRQKSAFAALSNLPPGNVLPPLADLLLETSSHRIQSACLDIMEQFGTAISLTGIRSDQWLEKLGGRIEGYDKICEIMGKRFLAYALMLGVQIRTLSIDPRFPVNTMVEFSVNDERVQTLTLGEFRVRTVQSLLAQKRQPIPASLPLTLENAAPVIGGKNLLAAPLFGISLNHLVLADVESSPPKAIIGYVAQDEVLRPVVAGPEGAEELHVIRLCAIHDVRARRLADEPRRTQLVLSTDLLRSRQPDGFIAANRAIRIEIFNTGQHFRLRLGDSATPVYRWA